MNQWTPQQFQEKFKNVVECWPEAGLFASALLPFRNADYVTFAFHHYLEQLPEESEFQKIDLKRLLLIKVFIPERVQILQKHPELGEGKFSELTEESKGEQQGAGLDQFNEYDISAFNQLKAA